MIGVEVSHDATLGALAPARGVVRNPELSHRRAV